MVEKKGIVQNVARKLMVLVFVISAIKVFQCMTYQERCEGRHGEIGGPPNMVTAHDAGWLFLKMADAVVGTEIELAF